MAGLSNKDAFWCHGCLRVTAEGLGHQESVRLEQPFARLGSLSECDVRLPGPGMPRRLAYLHATAEGVFAVPLVPHSRFAPLPGGWLLPQISLRFGPYRVSWVWEDSTSSSPATDLIDSSLTDSLQAARNSLVERGSLSRPWLLSVFVDDRLIGQYELTRCLTLVGRSPPSHLLLTSRSVSGCHCVIVASENQLWVVDLCSGNGTTIDGEPCLAAPWPVGKPLQIGRVTLVAQLGGPAAPNSSRQTTEVTKAQTTFGTEDLRDATGFTATGFTKSSPFSQPSVAPQSEPQEKQGESDRQAAETSSLALHPLESAETESVTVPPAGWAKAEKVSPSLQAESGQVDPSSGKFAHPIFLAAVPGQNNNSCSAGSALATLLSGHSPGESSPGIELARPAQPDQISRGQPSPAVELVPTGGRAGEKEADRRQTEEVALGQETLVVGPALVPTESVWRLVTQTEMPTELDMRDEELTALLKDYVLCFLGNESPDATSDGQDDGLRSADDLGRGQNPLAFDAAAVVFSPEDIVPPRPPETPTALDVGDVGIAERREELAVKERLLEGWAKTLDQMSAQILRLQEELIAEEDRFAAAKSRFEKEKSQFEEDQRQFQNKKSEFEEEKLQFQNKKLQLEEEKSQFANTKLQFESERSRFEQLKSNFERNRSHFQQDKLRFEEDRSRFEDDKLRLEQEKSRLEQDRSQFQLEQARFEEEKLQFERNKSLFEQAKSQFEQERSRLENERSRLAQEVQQFADLKREVEQRATDLRLLESQLLSKKEQLEAREGLLATPREEPTLGEDRAVGQDAKDATAAEQPSGQGDQSAPLPLTVPPAAGEADWPVIPLGRLHRSRVPSLGLIATICASLALFGLTWWLFPRTFVVAHRLEFGEDSGLLSVRDGVVPAGLSGEQWPTLSPLLPTDAGVIAETERLVQAAASAENQASGKITAETLQQFFQTAGFSRNEGLPFATLSVTSKKPRQAEYLLAAWGQAYTSALTETLKQTASRQLASLRDNYQAKSAELKAIRDRIDALREQHPQTDPRTWRFKAQESAELAALSQKEVQQLTTEIAAYRQRIQAAEETVDHPENSVSEEEIRAVVADRLASQMPLDAGKTPASEPKEGDPSEKSQNAPPSRGSQYEILREVVRKELVEQKRQEAVLTVQVLQSELQKLQGQLDATRSQQAELETQAKALAAAATEWSELQESEKRIADQCAKLEAQLGQLEKLLQEGATPPQTTTWQKPIPSWLPLGTALMVAVFAWMPLAVCWVVKWRRESQAYGLPLFADEDGVAAAASYPVRQSSPLTASHPVAESQPLAESQPSQPFAEARPLAEPHPLDHRG